MALDQPLISNQREKLMALSRFRVDLALGWICR
jgi:hypothetical protein